MSNYRRIMYEDRCQIYALSKRGAADELFYGGRAGGGPISASGLRSPPTAQPDPASYPQGCREAGRAGDRNPGEPGRL
jgi:hypothetical protein